MINTEQFISILKKNEINFFTGVPDSLLSSLSACIEDIVPKSNHIIAANEGNAIAIAAGYNMGSDKIAAVYMQNSGLGNAINPLTSLVDKSVYRIPLLLIIGWRGEPDIPDEPQHIKQGSITIEQLELLGIPHFILDKNSNNYHQIIDNCIQLINQTGAVVSIVVRQGTFTPYKASITESSTPRYLTREEALDEIIDNVGDNLIISTTGKTSREIYEIRKKNNQKQQDFLSVGSMGHASSLALGVCLSMPDKNIYCIDGDGSVLMHMGSLAIIGSNKNINITHIILNNSAHESVGGQPTVADEINFDLLAKSCGYIAYKKAYSLADIKSSLDYLENFNGPKMLEIKIKIGSRKNLSRPDTSPEENKNSFLEKIHLVK